MEEERKQSLLSFICEGFDSILCMMNDVQVILICGRSLKELQRRGVLDERMIQIIKKEIAIRRNELKKGKE